MKRGLLIAVMATSAAVILRGQTFDVAAIKLNKSGEINGRFGGPPTRWTATDRKSVV